MFYCNLSERKEWLRPLEEYCLLGHRTCEANIYECFEVTSSSISRWRCYANMTVSYIRRNERLYIIIIIEILTKTFSAVIKKTFITSDRPMVQHWQ